jgi:hypothetical protein
MRLIKYILPFIVFAMMTLTGHGEGVITKTISLHYQSAENIIPILKPLLQPNEIITGQGHLLILKIAPSTLTTLRPILLKFDQKPIVYTVRIFQGNQDTLNQLTNNDNSWSYSTEPRDVRVRIQSIRILNGESATVQLTENVPILSAIGIGLGWGNFASTTFERYHIQNGFVIAIFQENNEVKLMIQKKQSRRKPTTEQAFETQLTTSTLLIPTDKWVLISSVESDLPTHNSIVYQTGDRLSEMSQVYIHVHKEKNE